MRLKTACIAKTLALIPAFALAPTHPATGLAAGPDAGPGPALFQATPESRELGDQINRLVRAGSWEQALPRCRRYAREFPGDARMLYNLACLENRAGQRQQAVAALLEALAAGFDEMGYALQDKDLAGVADHPDLWNLDGPAADRLARTADRKGFTLELGTWSPAVELDPVQGDSLAAEPLLRLRWQPTGLGLELTAPRSWGELAAEDLTPWPGRLGAVVILSIPDGTGPFVSGNSFAFAFETQHDQVVGAMYLPGPGRWQQIAEMNPKLRREPEGSSLLTGTIPWQSIMPYHPLVDNPLGINVVVRSGTADRDMKAALLPDPWASAPQGLRHRHVPLAFRTETLGNDLFIGKVSDSLSRQEPLTVAFTAVSTAAGTGHLTVDVVDGDAHSLLPQGPRTETLALPAGPHSLVRPVDFTGLRTGAYLVKAELVLPSGKSAAWSTTVLQLAPGWEEDFRARIDGLRPAERATARMHLDALTAAVAAHPVRRNPGPLANTVEDLQTMLARAGRTGSILPTQGAADFVYPGPQDQIRRCSLYLPAHADSAVSLIPILVLNDARGREAQILERIARNYEYGQPDSAATSGSGASRPIYVVPHLDPGAATQAQTAAEALACLDWALAYFGGTRAAVAGIDAAWGATLELARSQPARVSALLVFAGRDLVRGAPPQDPYPRDGLAPAPAGVPLTWIDFVQETAVTGQGPGILNTLEELGWTIADIQQVRGGLSLSQAADRLVLWARTLGRQP